MSSSSALGFIFVAEVRDRGVRGVEQNLEGRHALLAVDDS